MAKVPTADTAQRVLTAGGPVTANNQKISWPLEESAAQQLILLYSKSITLSLGKVH
jgi:hypothetical protein